MYYDNGRVVLEVGVIVQNTSGQSFTINSFAGNLFANGYLAGNVSSFTPATILPNSEKIIVLKVKLGILAVVGDIVRAWQQRSFTQHLELNARANVDNLQVDIPLKYQIG